MMKPIKFTSWSYDCLLKLHNDSYKSTRIHPQFSRCQRKKYSDKKTINTKFTAAYDYQNIMVISGQTLCFLTIAMSMQAYLLQAKSLGGASQSTFNVSGNNHHLAERTASADSSCSPSQEQLDFYNQLTQLNSTNAVTSLNGNTMHYAFRAMKAHQNRTLSVATAEEDNAVIASINDPSRFTLAGMKRANKAVCAIILQELDAEAGVISTTALCPWDYVCDYKADRFPNYLFKARCKSSRCSGNCSGEDNRHNMCQSHGIHVTVLQMSGNCGEWVWGQELQPIACTCTNDVLMNA